MGDNPRATRFILWSLGAAVLLRLVLPRLFGLLDNDSISLFLDAENQALTGAFAKISTLQVYLLSLAYRVGGMKLAVARWTPLLAGLGTMLILYLQGDDPKQRTGVWAALLYGVLPISIFFGVSELPYGTMAFLATLAVWLLVQARASGRYPLGLIAGLALGGAFLCKTFAVVLVLPAIVLLAGNLGDAQARREKRWLPGLLAIAVWGLIVGGAIWWRWPVFGWSIFNDYPTDWRFDLASQIWSGRWVGLVNLHALVLPLLAPGVALAIFHRNDDPFVRLGGWSIAAVLAVYLFNPVNHFPRVLLPAMPFLAYLAAVEWMRALAAGRFRILVSWALLAFLLLVTRLTWPVLWLDGRPWTMLLATGAGLLFFAGVAYLWPKRAVVDGEAAVAFLLVAATFLGFVSAYDDLDRVERLSMARVEAVRHADATAGLLGGGDVAHLLMRNQGNISILTDLPRDRLLQVLREGLPRAMRALKLRVAIEDRADADGIVAMLRALAAEQGIILSPDYSPFAALATDPLSERLFDNGAFAVYRLTDVAPAETAVWPEWSRVEPEWDRTGLSIIHPTSARLVVTEAPGAAAPRGVKERRITADLTALSDNKTSYGFRVRALNSNSEVLWERAETLTFPVARNSPGVGYRRIAIDRESQPGEDTILPPREIQDIASWEIRVQSANGGRPLIALVRTPSWW